jgi:anti-sigma factor RsiW
LEQHLKTCPACRDFVAQQQAVWAALDEWEAAAISAEFDRQLYRRIETQLSWWERRLRPLRPLLVRHALPVAAAACLLVTVWIVLERPRAVTPASQNTHLEISQPELVVQALDDMEMLDNLDRAVRADAAKSHF